jgi:hypothetical protein
MIKSKLLLLFLAAAYSPYSRDELRDVRNNSNCQNGPIK